MGRRCSEREMQSPDFIGLLGDMQVWGARSLVAVGGGIFGTLAGRQGMFGNG